MLLPIELNEPKERSSGILREVLAKPMCVLDPVGI